jgi:ribosomal protein L21E
MLKNQFIQYLDREKNYSPLTLRSYLANFNSGDTVDIILMRGNVENFGKETIEVYNTNVHIAKIQ